LEQLIVGLLLQIFDELSEQLPGLKLVHLVSVCQTPTAKRLLFGSRRSGGAEVEEYACLSVVLRDTYADAVVVQEDA
jgi:hypothetical protein